MNSLCLRALLLALPLAVVGAASAAADQDLALLKERVLTSWLPKGTESARAAGQAGLQVAETLRADGSWADVDYQDQTPGNWKTMQHLSRLHAMATAYRSGETAGKPALRAKVRLALDYWLDQDFKNPNWWHNMIGVPASLGETLLLLEPDLTPAELAKGDAILDRATLKQARAGLRTGANLVWLAGNQVYRGLLEHSTDVVSEALGPLFAEIHVADAAHEGIQADASFHQHGTVLYAGGYGAAFVGDCTRFVELTRGTRFAPTLAQIRLLERYVLDGLQWMVRGNAYDYSVVGREIVRPGKSARGLAAAVERLARLPGPRRNELAAFAARLRGESSAPPLEGNRQFWASDYMVQSRAGYLTSARMYSTRMSNTDSLTNGEGRQSHHLADGAAFLYLTGNEYRDIFPVWDWRRVPGITCEQRPEPLVPQRVRRNGKGRFVGGVSDGHYGMAAMDLEYDALSAKKAWCYFDHEFVCLGAGITCTTENPVFTSVNQCLLNGAVTVAGRPAPLPTGEQVLDGVRWVAHDAVTYAFPSPTAVHVKLGPQSGSWADIAPGPAGRVTRNVFGLWIDHGKVPNGTRYEYVVFPGTKAEQVQAELSRIELLSNTPALQAVRHNGLKLLAAAFRQPGKLSGGPGWEITVDQPCLLLCREVPQGVSLSIANPENTPLTVTATLDRALAGEGCSPAGPGQTAVRFVLPEGLAAGSTLTRSLSASSH